jgi:hypothetical protein
MSKYWPLSEISQSPELHHAHRWELMCAKRGLLSGGTMSAVARIINLTKPVESPLAVVHGKDGKMTRIYLDYPEFDAWFKLERAGFVATSDKNCWFLLDNLH